MTSYKEFTPQVLAWGARELARLLEPALADHKARHGDGQDGKHSEERGEIRERGGDGSHFRELRTLDC